MKPPPHRPWRLLPALLGAVLLAASLTGCVYLRLLSVRRQLADFDRFFQVRVAPRPTIRFLHPILREDDPYRLLKLEPTSSTTTNGVRLDLYYFQKQGNAARAENHRFDLLITFLSRDGKLSEVSLPETFSEFITHENLRALFSHVEEARVDTAGQSAAWRAPELADYLSRREDIIRFLGQPSASEETPAQRTLTYRYTLKTGAGGAGIPDAARFILTLDNAKDYIMRSRIHVGHIAFDIRFDEPARASRRETGARSPAPPGASAAAPRQ